MLHILLGMVGTGKIAGLLGGENGAVGHALRAVVGDLFHDHRGFFLVDEPDRLGDEFLRIVLQHSEDLGAKPCHDAGSGAARQLRARSDFADHIVLDGGICALVKHVCPALLRREGIAAFQLRRRKIALLLPRRHRVLKARHKHLVVDVHDGLSGKLLAVKLHRVGILVLNQIP